jgi:hypothetical protein
MNFLTWGRNPWGQTVLTHISWSLLVGIAVRRSHVPRRTRELHDSVGSPQAQRAETAALEAKHKDLPDKIRTPLVHGPDVPLGDGGVDVRLLFTGVPADRRRTVRWVEWHWIAGLVLTGSIVYHIIHATFFLDFWSIWIGPKDIPEFKAEMMRELGPRRAGPKVGQVSARQSSLPPRHLVSA